jgi:hypothetical protein
MNFEFKSTFKLLIKMIFKYCKENAGVMGIIAMNVIPLAIITWIYFSNYIVVASLITGKDGTLWIKFTMRFGTLWLILMGCSIAFTLKERRVRDQEHSHASPELQQSTTIH